MEPLLDGLQREAGARVLRALAHPVRLGVLQVLSQGERTVTDLYQELGCSQSMMSQQLGILERQGLIRTRREGTTKHCALRNPDFLKLFACLRNHLQVVLGLRADGSTAACGEES
jgi:ArsR family transcriptional regulator